VETGAVWTGAEMIVWGGTALDGYSESFPSAGGRYLP
jgi:hypothetical protein